MRPIAPDSLLLRGSAALLAVVLLSGAARAEEAKKLGWSDLAELSLVATSGNASATTLGLHNRLKHTWADAEFQLDTGALRAETTATQRFAVAVPGRPGAFLIDEDSSTALTAENYFLRGRYDKHFTPSYYGFGFAGWERNQFAGVQNRTTAGAGAGRVWLDRGDRKFKTDAALTFTRENPVDGEDANFAGLRLGWEALHKFSPTTTFTHTASLDENLDDTNDLRGDMVNALAVAMTDRLAIKLALRTLFDKQPALVSVPVLGAAGAPAPRVLAELDELDNTFTAALVVNF